MQLRSAEPGETRRIRRRLDVPWPPPPRHHLDRLRGRLSPGGREHRFQRAGDAGTAIVAGRRCPFVGRVSMDLVIIDVTEVPQDAVRRGDPVILIGDGSSVDEVGARAGTIGYEILTGLGRRFARLYRGGVA